MTSSPQEPRPPCTPSPSSPSSSWCCDKARSLEAWDFLKTRLKALGLSEQGGILRTKANCLRYFSVAQSIVCDVFP